MVISNKHQQNKTTLYLTTNRIFPYIVLTLLAGAVLMPRIQLGINMFTLDDIIPLVAGAIGALWVLRTAKLPKSIIIFLLVIWAGLGFLTALYNATSTIDLLRSFAKGTLRPLNSLFLFVIIYQLTHKRPDRIMHTIHWIVWFSIFQGILAVVSYILGVALGRPIPELGLPAYSAVGHAVSRLVPGRFVGTTNSAANFVGAYFVMTIPLTLALALIKPKRKTRYMYIIAMGLQFFGLIITFTRASLLALGVVLIGMLFLLRKKQLLGQLFVLGLVFALVIFAAVPEYILRFTQDVGTGGRFHLWSVGLKMMFDYPWLGVGFDHFMDVVNAQPFRYQASYNPHNSYIMLGAEGGIGMFLTGISLTILSVFNLYFAFKRTTQQQERILLAGFLAGSVGFALQSLTNDLLYLPFITTYFWLFYVLGMNLKNNYNLLNTKSHPKPSTT